jgi:branched-subunit amino acid transport protein
MKTIRFLAISLIFGVIAATGLFAQSDSHTVTVNIPEIALLAINGGNVTLAVQEPTIPGEAGTGDSNADTRLFYTSLVPTLEFNKITAGAADASVPSGTSITVVASSISANGTGGTAAAPVTFTAMLGAAQDFITGIESAYTGINPATDGAVLTYTLSFADYTALRALATPEVFTVTYTITSQ